MGKHISYDLDAIIGDAQEILEKKYSDDDTRLKLSEFVDLFDRESASIPALRPMDKDWYYVDRNGGGDLGRLSCILIDIAVASKFAYKVAANVSSKIGNITNESAKIQGWVDLLTALSNHNSKKIKLDMAKIKYSARLLRSLMVELFASLPYAYGNGDSVTCMTAHGMIFINKDNFEEASKKCIPNIVADLAKIINVILSCCFDSKYNIKDPAHKKDWQYIALAVCNGFLSLFAKARVYDAATFYENKAAEKEGGKSSDSDKAFSDEDFKAEGLNLDDINNF